MNKTFKRNNLIVSIMLNYKLFLFVLPNIADQKIKKLYIY
jgi:hypothetical protein